jgi:hypothetical protein
VGVLMAITIIDNANTYKLLQSKSRLFGLEHHGCDIP